MFKDQLRVQTALKQKNANLAKFWFSEPSQRIRQEPAFLGRTVLVVDAEDTFTEMLAQQLTAIGLLVTIRKFNHATLFAGHWDLFVMGPGPGDPSNMNDNRIVKMRAAMCDLLAKQHPFFAVCLSHQILCLELGLNIMRKNSPNQGVQHEIDFFGTPELVGFYNTYAAECQHNSIQSIYNQSIEVCRDVQSNEVHALRGQQFASVQFHPESLLTRNGIGIITSTIKRIIKTI